MFQRTISFVMLLMLVTSIMVAKQLYPFQLNGKTEYYDENGYVVIEPKFDQGGIFSDNLAIVRVGTKFGYINIKGEFAIEPQFDYSWYFSGGIAYVKKNGKWGAIDRHGNFITKQASLMGH